MQPRTEERHAEDDAVEEAAQLLVPGRSRQPGEVSRHRSDVARYGHRVVVEHDDERQAQLTGMAHRLPGHAPRQCPVADHRDDRSRVAEPVVGCQDAQSGRNGGGRVARVESVMDAFRALWKTRQAAGAAYAGKCSAPAGDYLVRVALVPDIPHDRVARRAKDAVDGQRQLDDAQVGREMSAINGDGTDDEAANFGGEAVEFAQ